MTSNEVPTIAEARAALASLAGVPDETERLLETAAIIEEQMSALGISVAVVGGLAVSYWTGAQYVTTDIDVLMPSSPEAEEVLEKLGFRREGRVWVLDEPLEIVFEAPGSFPDKGDEIEEVETPQGRKLRLLKVEDMVLWRLREVLDWRYSDAIHQTIWLLEAPMLDRSRLESRAEEEGLLDPLKLLEERATTHKSQGVPFTDEGIRALAKELQASYGQGRRR
jgi:hypothetical protein